MIVTDFLQTDLYIPDQQTDLAELSDNIDDLALSYPDGWPDAYWFGWASWDRLPDAVKLSNMICSGTVAGWTYTATQGNANNFNVGYCATGFNGNSITWYSPINQIQPYTNVSDLYHDCISDVSPLMGTRFINSLNPQGVAPIHGGAAAAGENRIYVAVHVTDNAGRNDISVTTPNFEDTANGIYKFFSGTATKNIAISSYVLDDNGSSPKNYSFSYTLDINAADFGKTHNHVWSVDFTSGGNSFTANVWVCGFNLPVGADKISESNSYANKSLRILPIIGQKFNDNDYKTLGVFAYMHYLRYVNGTNQTESGAWGSAVTDSLIDTNIYTGGYYGTIDTTGIKRYEPAFNANANFCVINWGKSTNQTDNRVFRILSPDESLKLFAFNMRYVTTNSYTDTSYGFGTGIYVPHITENNEFLLEFLTGDFDTIVDDLRPWQYGNITDDKYNPEDLPPYEPPRDENENTGDKITRPATLGAGGTLGFITQYALRAADVTELGGLLWTSIFTSDYWKNYMFSLALDTGSLDLASILNFFISLRVYPFPLVNVPSYAQFGQDMYIGTGIMPLHFANNLHTINNYCDYVPGGSATVWNQSGRTTFFGDWRDYTNTEITLYIPYCGTVQLNPGDVVGNTVSVQYAVDFATGGCIAYVDLETGDGAGYPIAALPGQMGADIPLTATAAGQVAARLAGDAMNIAGLIGRGESEFIGGSVGAFGAAATGNIGGTVNALASLAGAPADMYGGLARQAVNMLSRGAVSAPMMGGARGFASFGAPQTPYIQIRRGIYPDFGADIMGNATAGVYTVGDLSGFVSGEIKTDSLSCSDYEKSQIKQLISRGIYV